MENHRILTTKELAAYIQLNEKTVIKQAQEGKLPGVKIGNQWRFHLSAVNEFLYKQVIATPNDELDEVIKTADHIIPLSRLTEKSLIALDVKATNKTELIDVLATMAFDAQILKDKETFEKQMLLREAMLSTSIGHGIAIPHPRDPKPGMFQRPYIMIARSKKGILFDAPDGNMTHLFFCICATNHFVHLRLLAKIAKLVHSEYIREQLLVVETKDEVIKMLMEFERDQMLIQTDK